jgi:(1->4)-alpha-D-glucan 1-alpha-D-glucosylmutase
MSIAEAAKAAMRRAEEGLPKLWTVHRALRLRRERPGSFAAEAGYAPLEVRGTKACHAIAYLRGEDVATVTPRLPLSLGGLSLGGDWQQTTVALPAGRWKNWLTDAVVDGGIVGIGEMLKEFPVALLVRQ